MRRTAIILFLCSIVVNLALFFYGQQIMLFYLNAKGGCFPWSPKEVEYHDNMTICPGQSTRMSIPLTVESPKPDKGI